MASITLEIHLYLLHQHEYFILYHEANSAVLVTLVPPFLMPLPFSSYGFISSLIL